MERHRADTKDLVKFGRLWVSVYRGRNWFLGLLASVAVVLDAPFAALFVVAVVLPFNQAAAVAHRRRGTVASWLPADQTLAAAAVLINPAVLPAAIICQSVSGLIAGLGVEARHARRGLVGAAVVTVAAAVVHDNLSVALFGLPALCSAYNGYHIVASVLRRYAATEVRNELILDGAGAGIWEINADDERVVYANALVATWFGATADQLVRLAGGLVPEDGARLIEGVQAVLADGVDRLVECRLKPDLPASAHANDASESSIGDSVIDDQVTWLEHRLVRSDSVNGTRVRALIVDVTARKTLEHELEHAALHDRLTGLGNRALAERDLAALRPAVGSQRENVLLIDMNRFKMVNDGLGHRAGDLMLVKISELLSAAVGPGDRLSRLGGDEFLVIHHGTHASAIELGQRLAAALDTDIGLYGTTVRSSASIGLAAFDDDCSGHVELLRRADVAMYRAKRSGDACVWFDPIADGGADEAIELAGAVHRAFDHGEFRIMLQPQVVADDGVEIIGYEALVRWQHPERGLMAPLSFLDAVATAGASARLASFMLADAIDQLARWGSEGRSWTVAVNLTALDLLNEPLIDWTLGEVRSAGIDPTRLTIEITESELMHDTAAVAVVLARLRAVGICISVDDYGTGYSSLVWLRDLPVSELKIDRSFAALVCTDERARTIVSATIDLARALSLQVVAEGVENLATGEALTKLGCTVHQGYYYGRPAPLADVAGADGVCGVSVAPSAG
jgi:diguanylate cyclase (GGDEF)-like protein